ncbi:paired box protein Pax-6-like [Lineus longissimus]|uniref:paired box protein Pax-6-like n=1 Tax=Lineus longissimus TaxID=88925 RepID=UPI00315D1F59
MSDTSDLEQLETAFKRAKYPDISILEELSGQMRIPMDKIATWFQNRRAKFKRDAKSDHKLWMREQVFQKVDKPCGSVKLDHVISPIEPKNERLPSSNVHHLPETTHQPFLPSINPYSQIPVTRSDQSLTDSNSHVPYFPPIVTQEYQQSRISPTTTTNCNRLPPYQTGTPYYSADASVFEPLPSYGDPTTRSLTKSSLDSSGLTSTASSVTNMASGQNYGAYVNRSAFLHYPNPIRQPLTSSTSAPSNFLFDNSYYQDTQSNGYPLIPSTTSYKATLPLPGYGAPPSISTSAGPSNGIQPFPAQCRLAQY